MESQYKLTVRDWIIERVAEQLDYPENICEKVVSWAYHDAIKQTQLVTSVELSGFGSFLVSPAKLKKRLELCIIRTENNPVERNINALEFLRSKEREYEMEGDIRGVEKRPDSTERIEGADSQDVEGKIGDMSPMPLQLRERKEGGEV